MKHSSILMASSVGLLMFLFFPLVFVFLNNQLSLPVFNNGSFKIVGILLILVGVIIVLYCTGTFFSKGRGTPVPIEPPKKMVVSGLYKYSRNPIYIAYLTIILGEFLLLGYILLFAYVLIAAILHHAFVVYFEEPQLKKRFRKSYEEYCRKVPRWIKI